MRIYAALFFLLATGLLGCGDSGRTWSDLHQEALVADMHSDVPMRMADGFDLGQRDTTGHMDIPRLREGGIDLQVFACWVSTQTPLDQCRSHIDEMIDTLDVQFARHADAISVCRTASEADRIIAEGKIAAFIGIENGVAIANDLENLQHFYDRGVRYMTLTHTGSNDWCISSADTAEAFGGLTDFGRDVVRKMNDLGMIIDVSHASVSAFDEVIKTTGDPVIASHSCVRSLCDHDRNLTDGQIRTLADNGGVVGINFYSGYLSDAWRRLTDSAFDAHQDVFDSLRALYPDDRSKRWEAIRPIYERVNQEIDSMGAVGVTTVVDHIDYIVKLVGPDHVGLGSDFDGVNSLPQGLSDCSMVPNITHELAARGYSDRDVKKILGGNFMRVFRQVCDQ